MSFTSRHGRQCAAQCRCALLVCLLIASALEIDPVLGQQAHASDVEQHLRRVTELFQALDNQAETCLNAVASDSAIVNSDRVSAESCVQFINAIDGEPVADYLAHCQAVKQWRDEFVARHAGSDAADSDPGAGRTLQRLVDIEFYCADDSLRLRTEHVFDAFAAVRQASRAVPGLAGQWSGLPTPQTHSGGSVGEMHERVRRETEQRWQQLQLDLLRQQSQQPVDYGLIQ